MTKLQYDQTSCYGTEDTMTVSFLFEMTKCVLFSDETTRLSLLSLRKYCLRTVESPLTLNKVAAVRGVNIHQAVPPLKSSQMASSRNFFLRRERLTNIKDALTRIPLRFE